MRIKQYKGVVASLGCIICGGPAELHHPRAGRGMSQRGSDWLCIPLCPGHHRLGTSYAQPSVHGAPQDFRARHGEEMDLLAETIRRVVGTL